MAAGQKYYGRFVTGVTRSFSSSQGPTFSRELLYERNGTEAGQWRGIMRNATERGPI